jgi:UDP-N-acetylglucosamine 2-epimerase (non-hydrolysing)
MSKLFFDDLAIPKPDYDLGVGSSSHARQTAEIMLRIEPVLEKEKPDYLVVVGDVNSTIAAALVAKKMGIQIIHVEAGLRSRDRSMPEEINRILTDAISDMLFITEKSARINLRTEGTEEEKIYFVGNVMVDTLMQHRLKADQSDILQRLGIEKISGKSERYALLTLHRPSNVDVPEKLKDILNAISDVSKNIKVIFPVHPRTADRINKMNIFTNQNIMVTGPQGYLDFLKLMSNADLVLTDSGGIQEETTVLGIPCLTLRENTERPVTIDEGTNRLVGVNRTRIISEVEEILISGIRSHNIPELWDGGAALRIVEVISKHAINRANMSTCQN